MLVEELKQSLNHTQYAYCLDGIISFALDRPREDIKLTDPVTEEEQKICVELANDWRVGAKFAYKRGKTRFMDLPLVISKDVFPPVIATERFVNNVIKLLKDKSDMLEIGTGSGSMAIAIAKNTNTKVVATDICPKALEIAKSNAKLNNVEIEFIESNIYENVKGKYDLIIANPPQQTTKSLDDFEKSGKLITPRIASDGGEDGFSLCEAIIAGAKNHLKDNGALALQLDGITKIYDKDSL